MGRVIRTFITAGGYRGEGDLDVSAKVAHSGEGEAAGARMHPGPICPTQRFTGPNRGGIVGVVNGREKWLFFVNGISKSSRPQRVHGRALFSFCPSVLGLQKVGVGASPQNAFGCRRQAKRSACSTRGWVKSTSPVKRVTASQAHSALQGAVLWGYPAFPASSVEPSSIKTRTTAQIRPILAGRGRDAPPPSIGPHSGPQGQTGAKSPGTP